MAAVLVTGAGSGIGAECARRLAREGRTILCADVDGAAAARVAATLPDAQGVALDVADADACDAIVRAAFDEGGSGLGDLGRMNGIDGLVTCAGVHVRGPAHLLTTADVRHVLEVNLVGTFVPAVAVGRRLLARAMPGSFVFIGSINSRVGQSGQAAYGASKAGVLALARSLAAEWGPAGIRVNCVGPGLTRTPMGAEALDDPAVLATTLGRTPTGRVADPADIAAVVAHLLSSSSRHVTGTFLAVDGGRLLGA